MTEELQVTKQAMFTLKLESELREQFMAEAEATHRPASQLVREFMRNFIVTQRAARDHDVWVRAEIEQGLREADDPALDRIPHDDIAASWNAERAELLKRTG